MTQVATKQPVQTKSAKPLPTPPSPTSLGDFVVALWNIHNRDSNFKLSSAQRIRTLDQALKMCQDYVDAHDVQADNAFHAIFLLPEYYFSKQTDGPRGAMSEEEAIMTRKALLVLSKKYPKILIVPGTIHYHELMTEDAKREAGYQLLLAAKQRVERQTAGFNRYVAVQQASIGVPANSKLPKPQLKPSKVLNATMSHGPTGGFSKVPSINELADSLVAGTATRRVRNATYLFLGGEIYGQYDKQADFYEALSHSPDKMMFIPGTQDQCPQIGNGQRKHRFGLEICADHANGILKDRNPDKLHFHLVVSDAVKSEPAFMAMAKGGYFLHASTNPNECRVFRHELSGMLNELTGTLPWETLEHGPGKQGSGNLYMCPLPLPKP